jgi:hypothetical protein
MTWRLRGPARALLVADVVARYEAGETIRNIAGSIGYSYTATRNMLVRAGVELRPPNRGGTR